MPTPLPKLGAPAVRALDSIQVHTLEQLCTHTRTDVAKLHDMGNHGLRALDAALAAASLGWKQ
jgi:hypothetical protein